MRFVPITLFTVLLLAGCISGGSGNVQISGDLNIIKVFQNCGDLAASGVGSTSDGEAQTGVGGSVTAAPAGEGSFDTGAVFVGSIAAKDECRSQTDVAE